MDKNLKYHINLILTFEKDINIDEVEKYIGIKAYRKSLLKESKIGEDNKKSAKIWFKSREYSSENTYEVVEEFLISIYEKFKEIPSILNEFIGNFGVQLIFSSFDERPIIELTKKSIEILHNIGANFSVNFI